MCSKMEHWIVFKFGRWHLHYVILPFLSNYSPFLTDLKIYGKFHFLVRYLHRLQEAFLESDSAGHQSEARYQRERETFGVGVSGVLLSY